MRNMVPFLDGSNPFIYKQNVDLGDLSLIGYSQTSTLPLLGGGIKKNTKTVHFFLDDYRFEEVWSTPEKYIKKLKQYKQVLGPDFSAYTQMPLELQRWNIFRGKWCCAYWQQQGLAVIPTVNWAGQNTYDWAFDGIEQGSIVALSTVGCYYVEDDFMQGFKEMVNRIKPDRVVNYGKNFDGMEELVDTVQVPYNFLKSDYNDDDFFKLDEDYKFVGEST
ncbi:hypothetical protein FACS1894125_0720 [Actinomycetota bacterium]|nr:hypothetical protein FACS1894125_0720 [Actinomycetota bacterium]